MQLNKLVLHFTNDNKTIFLFLHFFRHLNVILTVPKCTLVDKFGRGQTTYYNTNTSHIARILSQTQIKANYCFVVKAPTHTQNHPDTFLYKIFH